MVLKSELLKNKAFINGEWVTAKDGAMFDVLNPATGQVLGQVPDMGPGDATLAIDCAYKAYDRWKHLLPLDRANILTLWAELIEKEAESLSLVLTMEQGKPLAESRSEVLSCSATLRWCSEEARRLNGEFLDGHKPDTKIIISRHPVGIVAAITPWNFPASMVVRKVAPALASGCTVVLKPAEDTPLTALALADLGQKAGLPAGVFNVVTTSSPREIGRILSEDVRVRKISFTGSTSTGKTILSQSAQNVQKVSLELGGNAPFIIFPSADLIKAVDGAMASKFRNAGQTCICANRIYIHQSIYEQFLKIFLNKTNELIVGNGQDGRVTIGPLINLRAVERVENQILDSVGRGARILVGGHRHKLGGTYFEPTVVVGAPDDSRLAREEIFAPVAVLYSFETETEVVERANDTRYGLSSYIYSNDMAQVWRVSDVLEFGMVGINEPFLATDLAPFGGMKESGIGKEGGKYGLLEYTEIKYRLFG